MSDSQAHELRDSVYVGALSLGVALMSSSLVIRVVNTFLTSAGWEDSLDTNDPISSLVAMIAISGVVYSLLTRIKNRYGLIASLEGACWITGFVPILFWTIDKGRVLPDIANFPYLGLILFVAAICLGVVRAWLHKSIPMSTIPSPGELSSIGDDDEVSAQGGSDPSPHRSMGAGQGRNSAARRWMLVLAAAAAIAVAALVPRTFPLIDPESTSDPAENCRAWYDTRVVHLYKGQLSQWAEWSNALNAFVDEPGRTERVLSEIDTETAPAELTDRPRAIREWSAAQDDLQIEIDIALLDDHWDDDEMRSIASVRMIEMQALMDVLTLDILLADTVDFYPFPDSQDLQTDLRMAALGLERACDLEGND